MYKLIVFDLDNTLAPLGKPIPQSVLCELKGFLDKGLRLAVCSGKPTYYLCGFMRAAGLPDTILVGENGAVIDFGVSLPPKEHYSLPVSQEARDALSFVNSSLHKLLGHNVWFQPNQSGVTPFPVTTEEFKIVQDFIDSHAAELSPLNVYRHCDSFDFVPKNVNKKEGLARLCNRLGISDAEVIAVGDSGNDFPMFEFAGFSIGISLPDNEKHRVTTAVETIDEAVEVIKRIL
ncbi:MAG: HAD family phosphatase [Clostridia bacterium]|nr:HAD family phosphatase [Clostridia bacterium]